MPQKIGDKELSETEHRQWKHVYDSMKAKGLDDDRAAAAATSTVERSRQSEVLNPFARCPECGSVSVANDPFARHTEDTLRCRECGASFSLLDALPAVPA